MSLTVAEREALLDFAIKHVNGRVPMVAHVSDAGTAIAASLSHAGKAGAAAAIATVPYYWTPPQQHAGRAFHRDRQSGQNCRYSCLIRPPR